MSWNPYFVQKENCQYLENVSYQSDVALQYGMSKPKLQPKKISIQAFEKPVTISETVKYKRNKKQQSCIPFQMNIPQSTVTKIPQMAMKQQQQKKDENLKDSAIWERKDQKQISNQQITFESFLKEQSNLSRNNSNEQKQFYKKNHRQYSHAVQGNSGVYFMINNNTSQYSTCDKQTNQFSMNSNREEKKKTNDKILNQLLSDTSTNQLSDRTIKKQSPIKQLLKHKKNTRCISMGEQKHQTFTINLECEESEISLLSDNIQINQQNTDLENGYTQEILQNLMLSEMELAINGDYLKKQKQITPLMRAIVIHWMSEICVAFGLKRESFYMGISYLDQYLSKVEVSKFELQLLGATALHVAQKVQEIDARKIEEFKIACNYGYSLERILDMEIKICKTLNWHMYPTTINLWIEYYTNQWDQFSNDKKFRFNNDLSYQQIQQLYSFIDCSYLDIQTLNYKPRTIVASFMYLVLAIKYEYLTKEYIYQEVPKNSKFILVDSQKPFNKLFSDFVQFTFGFNLVDLLPVIKYASGFIMLEHIYDEANQFDNINFKSYEDLLTQLTHNSASIRYVQKRFQK